MLRKILLVVSAIVAAYSFSGISGYTIYTLSQGRGEAQLSLSLRFIFNPGIALVVGATVGFLSRNHPAIVTTVGLAPWAVMLHGSSKGAILGWVSPILIYLAIGAIASVLVWRIRNRRHAAKATPQGTTCSRISPEV